MTPSNRVISIVGERVFLECVATGEPIPTVSWKSGQRRRSDVLPEASDPVSQVDIFLFFFFLGGGGGGQFICRSARKFASLFADFKI